MNELSRKDADLQAWKAWKKSNSMPDLEKLLSLLDPIVRAQVMKWTNSMPETYLRLEARRLAVEALRTYDPNRGTSVATHVTNGLLPLSRTVYTHQNAARLPEADALRVGTYNRAVEDLENRTGRPPSVQELSEQLGWSAQHVQEYRRKLQRTEVIESGNTAGLSVSAGNHVLIDYAYQGLNPVQRKIFEYSTGYGGEAVLTPAEQMKKLKLSQGQYSHNKQAVVRQMSAVASQV